LTDLKTIFYTIREIDWIITLIASLVIFLLLIITEIIALKWNIDKKNSRKFIHISVGILICIYAYFLTSILPLLIISLIFVLVNWLALRKNIFKSIHPDSYSLGTVYYPISIFVLCLFLWMDYKNIFIISTLIMVLADPIAAIIGEKYAQSYFNLLEEKKSFIGSTAMFTATFFILFFGMFLLYKFDIFEIVLISLMIAVIAAVTEMLSKRGSDNLFVPAMVSVFLISYLHDPQIRFQLIAGEFLSMFVSLLSLKIGFLKPSGAAATFLLGSIIFGFGGFAFAAPILTFFLLSSLLSRLTQKRKLVDMIFQKTGVRDFYQVMANGGLAGVIVLIIYFFKDNSLYLIYLSVISAATADTWATEIGIFSQSNPRLITTLKKVSAGTSGAISLMGSIAAIAGSVVITIIGYYSAILMELPYQISTYLIFIIPAGFLGSMTDSFIGATLQSQYQCEKCLKITEKEIHCNKNSRLIKGFKFIDNDVVNFIATFFAGIFIYLLLKLFL